MNKMKFKNIVFLIIGISIGLFALGTSFLWASWSMPVFRDETAYNTTYEQIATDLSDGKICSDQASERFYRNQDVNMSSKYRLESIGWSVVGASVYAIVGACWLVYIKRRRKLPRVLWLYVLATTNVIIYMGLDVVSTLVDSDRNLYPSWADSMGIPLFSTILISPFVLGMTVGLVRIVTSRYAQTPHRFKFLSLTISYKIYIIISSLIGILLLVDFIQYPDYGTVPFIAGSILFNCLVFAGVSKKR